MVKVYPNPASSGMLINFGAVWKSGEIIVFNAIGQRLNVIRIENQDHVYIYKNRFVSGIYTLKFVCSHAISGILRIVFAD
jgi:hypothetical protein